jgi:hypothetical protein
MFADVWVTDLDGGEGKSVAAYRRPLQLLSPCQVLHVA